MLHFIEPCCRNNVLYDIYMRRKHVPIIMILFILFTALCTWLLLSDKFSNSTSTFNGIQQPSSQGTVNTTPGANDAATQQINNSTAVENPKPCGAGRIIVYFNSNVIESRKKEIISLEGVGIKNELSAFNGYILFVNKGEENQKTQSFLKYSEIKSAGVEGCPDTTNSADTAQ